MYSVRVKPKTSVILCGILYEPENEYSIVATEKELSFIEKCFSILNKTELGGNNEIQEKVVENETEEVKEENAVPKRKGRPPKNNQ